MCAFSRGRKGCCDFVARAHNKAKQRRAWRDVLCHMGRLTMKLERANKEWGVCQGAGPFDSGVLLSGGQIGVHCRSMIII